MKKFIKKYSWIVLLIFALLLFPQSLSDQAKLNMRVIITGVGVDYIDDQYQITSQIVLPKNGTESGGISAHISYITAQADTISEGIQKVSYKLGKLAELGHLEFVLVGETMKNHNIASALDYFFRNFKLKKSVMLLACEGQAKDSIYKTKELELGVALSLQKIMLSNQNTLNGAEISYVDFISQSASTSGCSVIETLVIATAQEDSLSQGNSSADSSSQGDSSGDQAQASAESSQSAESAKIITKTPLILFKQGKYVGKLTDEDQILGYYLTDKKSQTGNIFLNNFSYTDIADANINLRIDNMTKSYNVSITDDKIVHTINIDVHELKIDEIAPQYSSNLPQYKQIPKKTQDEILKAAKQKIQNHITSTFIGAKEQNFDIFRTADLCYKLEPIKWQIFVNNLDENDNYLQHTSIEVKVNFDRVT